jgi:hypothetical protein
MILYHISTELDHDGNFYPRIPESIRPGEDEKFPRICVSSSVEGCFSAIPNGSIDLDYLNYENGGYYKLFTIDTKKLKIWPHEIIKPDYLYEKELVEDAQITDEHWILKEFSVPKEFSQIIRVTDWREDAEDLIPHWVYKIAEKTHDGDYLNAYMDFVDSRIPSVITFDSIDYISETIEAFKPVVLEVCCNEEVEAILRAAQKRPDIVAVKIAWDKVSLQANKKTNISDIMREHHISVVENVAGTFCG